jgi:hypothetical protein
MLLARTDRWQSVRHPIDRQIDRLTVVQRRRIALQARSPSFAYVGSRVGGWISAFASQFEESDEEFKTVTKLRKLISEPGTGGRMVQAFRQRQRHLLHVFPYLSWLVAQ